MIVMKCSRATIGYVFFQTPHAHPCFAVNAIDAQIIDMALAKKCTLS